MDFCINCQHIELADHADKEAQLEFAKCNHPNSVNTITNLVSGLETKNIIFCEVQRDSPLEERCGPEGEWFEDARCETCEGTGELEGVIPNSQPPDWKVTKCEDCRGTGDAQ
jgi:DnaJ-class molecular chaperone